MRRRELLAGLAAILSGCGGGGDSRSEPASPAPSPEAASPVVASDPLKRLGVLVKSGFETSLIEVNGELLMLTFDRPLTHLGPQNYYLRVRRWDGTLLAEHPWAGKMGSAIVKDGVIHIFGSVNGAGVAHSTLAADFTPSAPSIILNDRPYSNVDVTADPGGFRMVLETTERIYFASSPDIDAWTLDGGAFNEGNYTGCPSIHFANGTHFFTYLAPAQNGRWETKVAASDDNCATFRYGRTILSSIPGEGINCSDVDLIEFNGKVCGVYLDGDQATWGDLLRWEYGASLPQMFADYL